MGLSGRVSWSTYLHEKFATKEDRDAWIAEIYGPLGILYASASVSEDDPNGTEVVAAPVVAGPGALPLTFFLTDDAGGRFSIDASTGAISLKDRTLLSAAIASTHTAEVTVEDQNGLAVSSSLQITVTASQQGDPPVITFSEQVILREGDANGTVAGIALFSGGVGSVTLSLQSNPDGIFAFNASTGELTLNDSVTFESLLAGGQTTFAATIRATDSATPTPNVDDEAVSISGVLASYDPVAVHYESANEEYGLRTSALTNAISSDQLTVAFAFNKASIGSDQVIVWGWPGAGIAAPLSIRFPTTNELRIFAADTNGNTLLTLLSAPLTNVDEWNFCLFSCRDGATKKDITFLINGANALDTESVNINGDIAIPDATHWTYGAGNNGPGTDFWYYDGGLDFFMLAQTYVAGDSGFIDGDGKLINPGSNGSAALGSIPLLFFGGPDFSIGSPLNDHSGNGNHFTPVGTLSVFEPGFNDAPEEPSGTVIEATSLSKTHVTEAINAATADGDIILLPDGNAGYTTPLAISSPFKIHIRGQDWLASKAAYQAAIDNLNDLAEVVHDATLAGSGRAAAWADYKAAHDDFLPTTTGLRFTVQSPDITLSRLGFRSLTFQDVDPTVYWCRVDTGHVNLEASHLGGGLIAQCVGFECGIHPSARVNSSSSQSFWDSITVTPGGTDMPWIQDCFVIADDLSQAQGGSGAAAVDPTWHGGKAGARRCVFSGSNGGAVLIRIHGFYRNGSNCVRINSSKWLELHDILCINDVNQSWKCIEWAGGGGYINNVRNTYKGGALYVKYEEVSRSANQPACNQNCSAATSNYPNNDGQTEGSGDGGLYINNLYHKSTTPMTSEASAGFDKQCTSLFVEDRDFHFGPKPNYTGLGLGGTHPFESRIVF